MRGVDGRAAVPVLQQFQAERGDGDTDRTGEFLQHCHKTGGAAQLVGTDVGIGDRVDRSELQQTQELQKEFQKNFESRVVNLEQASTNLIEAVKQTNETVKEVSRNVDELSKNVDELSKNVGELRSAQKETDERLRETDERLRETDERLNAVIYMAEKFFSRGNGNPEQI